MKKIEAGWKTPSRCTMKKLNKNQWKENFHQHRFVLNRILIRNNWFSFVGCLSWAAAFAAVPLSVGQKTSKISRIFSLRSFISTKIVCWVFLPACWFKGTNPLSSSCKMWTGLVVAFRARLWSLRTHMLWKQTNQFELGGGKGKVGPYQHTCVCTQSAKSRTSVDCYCSSDYKGKQSMRASTDAMDEGLQCPSLWMGLYRADETHWSCQVHSFADTIGKS